MPNETTLAAFKFRSEVNGKVYVVAGRLGALIPEDDPNDETKRLPATELDGTFKMEEFFIIHPEDPATVVDFETGEDLEDGV